MTRAVSCRLDEKIVLDACQAFAKDHALSAEERNAAARRLLSQLKNWAPGFARNAFRTAASRRGGLFYSAVDDAVQHTLCVAALKMPKDMRFQTPGGAVAWVTVIFRNALIDFLRRPISLGPANDDAAPQPNVSAGLEVEQLLAHVKQRLENTRGIRAARAALLHIESFLSWTAGVPIEDQVQRSALEARRKRSNRRQRGPLSSEELRKARRRVDQSHHVARKLLAHLLIGDETAGSGRALR